jgi:hypothetical protein
MLSILMAASVSASGNGIPPFHVHPGHAFEGFELVERPDGPPTMLARCDCGAVLDLADALFARCPVCFGRETTCTRCGGTGRVVDHAALEWRAPAQ